MKINFFSAAIAVTMLMSGCSDSQTEQNTETNTASAASETTVQTTTGSIELTDTQKANLDEFFNSIDIMEEDILKGSFNGLIDIAMLEPKKTITYGESMTKKLVDKVRGADEFRVLYADDGVKMETAVKGSKMKISLCIDTTASAMIFDSNTVYSYYPIDKSGYKITLSEEDMKAYTPETLLNSMIYSPESDDVAANISSIAVDDEIFTCELFEGYAYIFRNDGTIAMFCDNSNSFTARIETENISDDVFAIPSDYSTIDYNQLFENIQPPSETASE